MNKELKQAVKSYLQTALWSSSTFEDCEHEFLDAYAANYEGEEPFLSFGVLKRAIKDCKAFIDLVKSTFDEETADYILDREASDLDVLWPHDFWLTRNGHGAGFWDGDWEEGDKLTELSKKFGGIDLYIGDDGRIYC